MLSDVKFAFGFLLNPTPTHSHLDWSKIKTDCTRRLFEAHLHLDLRAVLMGSHNCTTHQTRTPCPLKQTVGPRRNPSNCQWGFEMVEGVCVCGWGGGLGDLWAAGRVDIACCRATKKRVETAPSTAVITRQPTSGCRKFKLTNLSAYNNQWQPNIEPESEHANCKGHENAFLKRTY